MEDLERRLIILELGMKQMDEFMETTIKAHFAELKESMDAQNTRIRELEKYLYIAVGALAVLQIVLKVVHP